MDIQHGEYMVGEHDYVPDELLSISVSRTEVSGKLGLDTLENARRGKERDVDVGDHCNLGCERAQWSCMSCEYS